MKKIASYGRIKKTNIGGFAVPIEYRHIKEYETEILKLKEQGLTLRKIREQLGFTRKQIHKFIISIRHLYFADLLK